MIVLCYCNAHILYNCIPRTVLFVTFVTSFAGKGLRRNSQCTRFLFSVSFRCFYGISMFIKLYIAISNGVSYIFLACLKLFNGCVMYKIDWEEKGGQPSKFYKYKSRFRALEHFDAAIKRKELRGKGYVMRLFHNDILVCCHHHDSDIGSENNWDGRLFQIPFPVVGRPASKDPRTGRSVSLSASEWQQAERLGGGNVSRGISVALSASLKAERTTLQPVVEVQADDFSQF